MPVSHLGLTVSHIPSATSFYLSALRPLRYRYIGERGDSVGLGVDEADFFLTQEQNGRRPSPTHIAFAANDRAAVRQCYAASIKAGGRRSGRPSYREDDCNCFNAAVEDLDGNTVEFIWRDVNPIDHRSYARPPRDLTTMDPRAGGLKRASTDPVESTTKSLFGVVLGAAAAGAAVGYAMLTSEKDDRPRPADYREDDRRRRSVSASARSDQDSRYNPRLDTNPSDDGYVSYVRTRHTLQSNGQRRAREAIEYNPSRYTAKRSSTMPVEAAVSSHSSRRGSVPEARSRRDSVVSHKSSRPGSQASTIKPANKTSSYYSAAQVPLPRSEIRARYPAEVPLPPSEVSRSRYTAAEIPLPPSEASRTTSRRSHKKFDAYYLPDEDESDGLGDTATIVPDDSISCIGSSRRRRSRSKQRSVMTMPFRTTREDAIRMRPAYSNA